MTGSDQKTHAAGASSPAVVVGPHWEERRDAPVYSACLWPNRSLSAKGRGRFIRLAALGMAVPLVPIAGTPVLWIPLAFTALVLGALWYGLVRNTADGRLEERVAVWPDEMRVERIERSGRVLRWSAQPFFVRVRLHESGPVESYLTLAGGGREIELGAFLSPDERVTLSDEIETAIRRALVTGRS